MTHCPAETASETDRGRQTYRLKKGMVSLLCGLFCFVLLFVVYFLMSDVMRRARTICWKEYREVFADLPCFVASLGGGRREQGS